MSTFIYPEETETYLKIKADHLLPASSRDAYEMSISYCQVKNYNDGK